MLGRARPELDAAGVRTGGFVVFPELVVEEQFTDNVFATKRNKKSDQVTVLHPRMQVKSNWNRHALHLESNATIGIHAEETAEDYQDHRHLLYGQFELARDTVIRSRVQYASLHELRRSSDDSGGIEPSKYDILVGGGDIRKEMGKFNFSLGGEIQIMNFDDNVARVGGAPVVINGDDRDRETVIWSGRVGYEIIPDYEAFVRGSYNNRDYDDAVDDSGIDRDSQGYEVVSGLEVDFGGLIFGDFYAGFTSQNIDDSSLKTVAGPTYGAGLTWIPTGMTSVYFSAERHFEDTTLIGAAGSTETNLRLTVDHELMRNLLLQFDGGLSRNHFKGLRRDDDIMALSVHANYLMNRRMNLFLGYTFEKEDSDVSTQDFERNLVKIRFTLKI